MQASAFGPKLTSLVTPRMSVFEGKADFDAKGPYFRLLPVAEIPGLILGPFRNAGLC